MGPVSGTWNSGIESGNAGMVEGGKYRSIPTYNLPVAILEANPPTRSGTLMVPAGSSPVSVSTETAKEPAVMMSRPISAGTFHPVSENLEAKSSVRFFWIHRRDYRRL